MKTIMEEIKEELDNINRIANNTPEDSEAEDLNSCISDMMNAIDDLKSTIDMKYPKI